jgi:hypothetical protein
MTPALLLQTLRTGLAAWAQTHRAALSIASDAWNALELLASGPASLRIILRWDGDSQDADQDAGIVKHKIAVIVSGARALLAQQGQHLVDGSAATGKPLYESVSAVRAVVRSLEFPGGITSGALRYAGCQPFTTPEGVPIDAYELLFEIDASIPIEQEPS